MPSQKRPPTEDEKREVVAAFTRYFDAEWDAGAMPNPAKFARSLNAPFQIYGVDLYRWYTQHHTGPRARGWRKMGRARTS